MLGEMHEESPEGRRDLDQEPRCSQRERKGAVEGPMFLLGAEEKAAGQGTHQE